MTIAADYTAYGVATKRIQVTSTTALLGGAAGFLAEDIPSGATHIALVPEASGVHLNIGTDATANTFLVPLGGLVLNGEEVALESVYLYSATNVYVHVFIGGNSCKMVLGASLATGDISIGNVGLLGTAENEIEPAGGKASNAAFAAGDQLAAMGGVKSATRHTAAELETFADDDWVPLGVTAVHELRVRDDDANTDMDTLVSVVQAGQADWEDQDKGFVIHAARIDSRSALATENLNYSPLQTTANGDLRVRDDDANTDIDTLVTFAQAANTAYAAADMLTPIGGVKSAVRHTAAELETFADDDYIPISATATHELRVRDDDLNTATAAEAAAATKGMQILLDNGATGTFAQCDSTGALKTTPGMGLSWANAQYTKIDQTGAAGVTALTTGATGTQRVYLMGLFGTMETAGALTIEDEDGTDISGPMPLGQYGGLAIGGMGWPVLKTTVDAKDLAINTTQKFYGYAVCIVQ